MNYKSLLKSKKFKIAVWGTGYIGLSTMVYFAKKKIKCIGYDVNKEKIKKINSGALPLEDLRKWFGFNIKGLVKNNKRMLRIKSPILFTLNWIDI